MEPIEKETVEEGTVERLRRSWIPAVAAVGALASLIAAAFRVRPSPTANLRPMIPGSSPEAPQTAAPRPPAAGFEREYTKSGTLGGKASAHPFQRSLAGVAIGPGDRIFALGDDEVRIFEPAGNWLRAWKVMPEAACLAAGPDGEVYVGGSGRVEVYDSAGARTGGFAAGDPGQQTGITAVKVYQKEIFVADADARLIRRFDSRGTLIGLIGTKTKTGSFILPNGWLDFDIDRRGVIRATDTGRHLVSAWAIDGSPLGSFGKFGMSEPQDFVGCCNPVNLACMPDGNIVTGEKMVARVKVYEPGGRLIAVIGPEHFDQKCIHIHLAVDSKGRILAADHVRREILIFSPAARMG